MHNKSIFTYNNNRSGVPQKVGPRTDEMYADITSTSMKVERHVNQYSKKFSKQYFLLPSFLVLCKAIQLLFQIQGKYVY